VTHLVNQVFVNLPTSRNNMQGKLIVSLYRRNRQTALGIVEKHMSEFNPLRWMNFGHEWLATNRLQSLYTVNLVPWQYKLPLHDVQLNHCQCCEFGFFSTWQLILKTNLEKYENVCRWCRLLTSGGVEWVNWWDNSDMCFTFT
jgi:hypothetical protein